MQLSLKKLRNVAQQSTTREDWQMTGQAIAQEYRIREWAETISARKQSGKTIDEWCAEHEIGRHTYFYRLRKVREYTAKGMMPGQTNYQMEQAARKTPIFAALPTPRSSGSAATVQIGAYIAEIHNGADAETVENVLRTLTRL